MRCQQSVALLMVLVRRAEWSITAEEAMAANMMARQRAAATGRPARRATWTIFRIWSLPQGTNLENTRFLLARFFSFSGGAKDIKRRMVGQNREKRGEEGVHVEVGEEDRHRA